MNNLQLYKQGSYGHVYIDKYKKYIKKYTNIFSNCDELILEPLNLKEVIALKTIPSHPNIIRLLKVKCSITTDENKISGEYSLKIPYYGITLYEWCKSKSLSYRLEKLPFIVYQILSALDQFHSLNIVHCDLKPDNILIDINDKIKVIDLGACIFDTTIIPIHNFPESFNMCTYEFSSPELLSISKNVVLNNINTTQYNINKSENKYKINCKHDIFSLGLIIDFICSCNYYNNDETIKTCIDNNILQFPINEKYLNLVSPEFKEIWMNMLYMEPEKRISTKNLLDEQIFSHFSKSDITHSKVKYNINYLDIPENRTSYVSYIFDICKSCKHICCLAVWIMDKFYSTTQNTIINKKVVISCIYIADCILQNSIFNISENPEFTEEDIVESIFDVLYILRYKVFVHTFDYYLRLLNLFIDYSIIQDIVETNNYLYQHTTTLIHTYKEKIKTLSDNKEKEE